MPTPSAPRTRLSLGLAVVTASAALTTLSAPSGAAAVAADGPPAIVSLLRQTSPTAGGVAVRVYGSGLEGTTSVSVGGTPVPGFAVIDSTLLTLTTPAGAANSRATIAITDNQGTTQSVDDNTRVLYTDGTLAVTPDTALTGGQSVSYAVAGYVPSVGGVGLQLNPLAAFLENPPDWGGGPPPYAVPKVFGATNAAGAYATTVVVDSPFVGSGQGPAYDPNVACPVTQVMADHGIRNCWLVFSQYGVGALEHPISFVTDPTPAPPPLVPSSSNATVGQQISLSGLHWTNNAYFGSDTTPTDPGETRLSVELCDSAQLSCAPAPGAASVALTRYFDDNATAPGVQPRFSGAELVGSVTVDNQSGCAPSCVLRVRQEGYGYPAGGATGTFIAATAPMVVSQGGTTTTSTSASTSTTSPSTTTTSPTTTTTTMPPPPGASPAPVITTLAGGGLGGDGGSANQAGLAAPTDVKPDGAGNLYIADRNRVRRVDGSGVLSTVAGRGVSGYGGDGGPATQALMNQVRGLALGASGDLYIADSGNNRVRRVDTSGIITTVAGTGVPGPISNVNGDGGRATLALLNVPLGVAVDGAGNLYIGDSSSVRKVVPGADGAVNGGSDEIITTVAGGGAAGSDGGPATRATLARATALALDGAGSLYIAETGRRRIRKVVAGADGVINGGDDEIITTVAGTGQFGFAGDGGPATLANLSSPQGLALDEAGDLYVGDSDNHRVRKVVPGADGVVNGGSDEVITTVAGMGADSGFGGDGGPATQAKLNYPQGVALYRGDLFIADSYNSRVRVVAPDLVSVTTTDTPDPVLVGQELTYTTTVAAYSNATAVTLTDTLPAGSALVSAAPAQGSCAGVAVGSTGTLHCDLGGLGMGQTTTVTVRLTAPAQPTLLTIRAVVGATEADPYARDDTSVEQTQVSDGSVSPPTGSLVLTKTASPYRGTVGQPLTYTLAVTNGLPLPATGVVLTDPLPNEVSLASATPTQGSCVGPPQQTGTTLTCDLGSVASGATATVTIAVTPRAGGYLTNTATVRANEVPADASASATSVVSDDNCNQVITTDTTLTADIGPCFSGGPTVGADGITLDLGGHRVFSGVDPVHYNIDTAGITVANRRGVSVANGTVSGFLGAGVVINGGGSNTVKNVIARDNLNGAGLATLLGDGIVVLQSPDNHIVGNTVVHNGQYDGIGVLGRASNNNTIEDNLVEDTVGPTELTRGPGGQGIIVTSYLDNPDMGKLIHNNTIRNNTVRNNASAGIANMNNTAGLIEANTVTGSGRTHAGGNGIGLNMGLGVPVGTPTNMVVRNNQVHANAWNGIDVRHTAGGNRILDNDASANNAGGVPMSPSTQGASECQAQRGLANPGGSVDCQVGESPLPVGVDLHDGHLDPTTGAPTCADDVWWGNIWGTGGFAPACTAAGGHGPVPTPAPARHPVADFDGNGASDVSVFRPSDGSWYVSGATPEASAYGAQGDVAVPGDYDGDGRTDRAVYRPEVGTWYVHNSTNDTDTLFNYGLSTDIAVPADYDGDGRADIAVFRPDSATWFVHQSSTNSDVILTYGIPGDIAVVGDYDGDAKADVAVYRPSSGDWFVHKSSGGDTAVAYGGNPGDVPTPGDYDGDGRTDTAIYRPAVGTWYVHNSGANTDTLVNYGVGADQPQPGDYDGDGKTDLAVFRPGASTWFARNSSNGTDFIVTYGIGGDVPLPLPAAIRRFFY